MADPTRRRSRVTPFTAWFNRLFEAKLTPGIAVLFFVALAVMCGLAAGIGYVAQNLRHSETRAR